ncbi:MAG TPA: Uma2 family endonuclease [Rhodopila sp.]|nr:Uma2 family endonuclease [Rhodopila sp.]
MSVAVAEGSANLAGGSVVCYDWGMEPALQIPSVMTLEEFLAWDAPPGVPWQLVDGEPRAMAPGSRTHNLLQTELSRLIGNHFVQQRSACSVIVNPGIVPRIRAASNFRVPDLAVTCSAYQEEEYALTDPVLVVEILSPSNKAETWANVWAYTTIPSVQEILILHSTRIGAEILRRDAAGNWPERAEVIEEGALALLSIGFTVDLAAVYRGTRLAPR